MRDNSRRLMKALKIALAIFGFNIYFLYFNISFHYSFSGTTPGGLVDECFKLWIKDCSRHHLLQYLFSLFRYFWYLFSIFIFRDNSRRVRWWMLEKSLSPPLASILAPCDLRLAPAHIIIIVFFLVIVIVVVIIIIALATLGSGQISYRWSYRMMIIVTTRCVRPPPCPNQPAVTRLPSNYYFKIITMVIVIKIMIIVVIKVIIIAVIKMIIIVVIKNNDHHCCCWS